MNKRSGADAPDPSAAHAGAAPPDPLLRRQAEERAGAAAALLPEDAEVLSPQAMQRVLHELRVHQIELEMQNEELRRTQGELEAARAR